MKDKTRKAIENYVNENIDSFHQRRIDNLAELKLSTLLQSKNPYLFKAKNLNLAPDLVRALLDARQSSSEEGAFGGFLEDLAIFVAKKTGGGQKSTTEGIDIELERKATRYLIAVKSGKNWGNSGQHKDLRANFKRAVKVLKQSKHAGKIQPTLGICYGKFRTVDNGEYLHIGGQSFWHLLSKDPNLYIDLIEPVGFRAEEHDKIFQKAKGDIYNRFVGEFINTYCEPSGAIRWEELVRFVSENMPRK